jgi:hypothetical protein
VPPRSEPTASGVCFFVKRLETGKFRWPNLRDGVLKGGL